MDLDERVAMEIFGWKWMPFVGVPVRRTPGYPKKCRVRRLFSQEYFKSDVWKRYLEEHGGEPATGDELLDYSYCSSQGGTCVPPYSESLDACREIESELYMRGLADEYTKCLEWVLGISYETNVWPMVTASAKHRCLAALKAVGVDIKVEEV